MPLSNNHRATMCDQELDRNYQRWERIKAKARTDTRLRVLKIENQMLRRELLELRLRARNMEL